MTANTLRVAGRFVSVALLLIAWSNGLAAAEGLSYTLGLSVENSDNMNESSLGPIAQTALIPRLNFDWSERGSVLQVLATGQLEYRDYLGGAFDNELRGQLSGIANWTILPQRLDFEFAEYAGVQPINVFATNAPGNQQQTNVFTLGPTLQFRIGNELRGETDLRLTDSTASVNKEFDSVRVQAAARAIRDLNPTDQLSANVEAGTVRFTDSQADTDYDRYSLYARYLSKLARVDLDFALGYSVLNFAQSPQASGLLGKGKATWRATANSSLEVEFTRQYSDAAQSLSIDPTTLSAQRTGPQIGVGSVPVSSQVYLERTISAAYVFQSARLNFRLAPHYSNFNYSVAPSATAFIDGATNQTAHGGYLTADYALRPLWSLGFNAAEETRNYSQVQRRDEDLRYGLSLSNQLTRQWSFRADLMRNQRSSTIAGQGFGENIAMLTAIFKR